MFGKRVDKFHIEFIRRLNGVSLRFTENEELVWVCSGKCRKTAEYEIRVKIEERLTIKRVAVRQRAAMSEHQRKEKLAADKKLALQREKELKEKRERDKALEIARRPKLTISEAAEIALHVTAAIDKSELQDLVSVVNNAEQVTQILAEKNASLTQEYIQGIEKLYAETEKVDGSQPFYSEQLNADLNQCLSFGINAIQKKLVLSEPQTSQSVHEGDPANPKRTSETPLEAGANTKPNTPAGVGAPAPTTSVSEPEPETHNSPRAIVSVAENDGFFAQPIAWVLVVGVCVGSGSISQYSSLGHISIGPAGIGEIIGGALVPAVLGLVVAWLIRSKSVKTFKTLYKQITTYTGIVTSLLVFMVIAN